MTITSCQNPTVKNLIALRDKKGRERQNAYLVEGAKMVKEALQNNLPVKLIIGRKELVDEVNFGGEKLYAEDFVLDKISNCETCQGIFAVIEKDNNNFVISKEDCLLLDRVRDPGNLGTIIRTSVAVGIKNIYLYDCVDCYSPKVVRSSMSGIYKVNLMQVDYEKIEVLSKNLDFLTADLEGENLFDYNPKNNYCLIMGNEANGISKEVKALSKNFICIPMEEGIESLNVGVAYAVIIYQLKHKK